MHLPHAIIMAHFYLHALCSVYTEQFSDIDETESTDRWTHTDILHRPVLSGMTSTADAEGLIGQGHAVSIPIYTIHGLSLWNPKQIFIVEKIKYNEERNSVAGDP